jgi:hypothetical protein
MVIYLLFTLLTGLGFAEECLTSEQTATLLMTFRRLGSQADALRELLEHNDFEWYFEEDFQYLSDTLTYWTTEVDCIVCHDAYDLVTDMENRVVEQMNEVYPDWQSSSRRIAVAVRRFLDVLKSGRPTCSEPYVPRYEENPDAPDAGMWEPSDEDMSMKIINGSRVSSSRLSSTWPFIVSTGGCTGSLITRRCVLSAAHCGSTSSVRIGALSRNSGGTRVSVSSRRRHSSLDSHILVLSTSMSSIPRVTVAGYGSSWRNFSRDTLTWAAGYGATSTDRTGGGTLREVQVRARRTNRTRIDVRPRGSGTGGPLWGDSGGPLMLSGRQIGTVRSGDGRGINANYVSTETLGSWIRSICG